MIAGLRNFNDKIVEKWQEEESSDEIVMTPVVDYHVQDYQL